MGGPFEDNCWHKVVGTFKIEDSLLYILNFNS